MLQQNPYQNPESEQIVTDYNRSVSKPPTHSVSPEYRNDENTTISADNFETVGVLGEENLPEVLGNKHSSFVFSNHTGGIREIKIHEFGRLSKEFSMPQEGDPFLSISLKIQMVDL